MQRDASPISEWMPSHMFMPARKPASRSSGLEPHHDQRLPLRLRIPPERMPVPGAGVGAEEALLALEAAPQCGVRYLGPYRVGVVAGLRVAVFDSARTSGHQALIKELNAAEGDVDMLVTDEWPQGVLTGAAPVEGATPANTRSACMARSLVHTNADSASFCMRCAGRHAWERQYGYRGRGFAGAPTGSEAAAELAQVARPRYHFAASGGVFHQRAPYMNRDLGAGAHATRFIGLAAVGNAGKAKWAHALQVQPAAQMSQAELCTRPEGCSESPYMLALGTKRPVRHLLMCMCRCCCFADLAVRHVVVDCAMCIKPLRALRPWVPVSSS